MYRAILNFYLPAAALAVLPAISSLTGSVLTAAHYAVSGTPDGRNNSGYDPDLGSRLAGMPGVLRNAGYFQMLQVGHDPRFSGLDIFVGGAGYDKVFSALQIWREQGYKEFPHAIWGGPGPGVVEFG